MEGWSNNFTKIQESSMDAESSNTSLSNQVKNKSLSFLFSLKIVLSG